MIVRSEFLMSLKQVDCQGNTTLHLAVRSMDLVSVNEILKMKQTRINALNGENLSAIELLLSQGPQAGNVMIGRVCEVLKTLLQHRPIPAVNRDLSIPVEHRHNQVSLGHTLYIMICNNRDRPVRWFFSHVLPRLEEELILREFDQRFMEKSDTVLHAAVRHLHPLTAETLISTPQLEFLNVVDSAGKTPAERLLEKHRALRALSLIHI